MDDDKVYTKEDVLEAFAAGWKAHLSKRPGETLLDHTRAYGAAV